LLVEGGGLASFPFFFSPAISDRLLHDQSGSDRGKQT